MNNPFFSVIIPAYNRADFLKIAIDSVLGQDFTDFELIVVDDGSTDATQSIAEKIKDKRLCYRRRPHQGVSASRNWGIRKAKGRFIAFLDSDDRFRQNKLSAAKKAIKDHPEYEIFHTEEIWYRSGGLLAPKKRHQKPSGWVFRQAAKICCISISTAVIEKTVFKSVGGFDETMPAAEDYDFWLRATSQFKVFLIPEYLTIKQGGHASQLSHKYHGMDKFRIYALEKILNGGKLNSGDFAAAAAELKDKQYIYLKGLLKHKGLSANTNQLKEIQRLVFEINRRGGSFDEIISHIASRLDKKEYCGRDKFFALKKTLLARRYPNQYARDALGGKNIYVSDMKKPLEITVRPSKKFKPQNVFIEKDALSYPLSRRILNTFKNNRIITSYKEHIKTHKFNASDFKKPDIFITKEKWDFIKPCPCTRGHLACGYWIFNLGFGCPYDCSYCYLQHYTNFGGIILPANLNDFFTAFDKFYKKLKRPIRLGTGEFSDSLALDDITGYSPALIDYFKNKKKVIFELKTKSTNIGNLLTLSPPQNIVISWSLNPAHLAKQEELGAPGLPARLRAAEKIQNHGYKVAAHFDPIIHSENWEKNYQKLVNAIYAKLKPPLAWISLGTLRAHRSLKNTWEQRFPESKIFYGELFLGDDKKLRYDENLRKEIYAKMLRWIRRRDTKTPVYLCMEDKNIWQVIGDNFKCGRDVERYITRKY